MGLLLKDLTYDLLAVLTTLFVGLILYCKWRFTYWEKRNIHFIEPGLFIGNFADVYFKKSTLGVCVKKLYKQLKERGCKYGGVFFSVAPIFMPIDPEVIKLIMQNDFGHFINRGGFVDEEADPLSAHLFNLENERWKNLRNKLSPAFTSGKMKMMFHTITDCTNGFKDILDKYVEKQDSLDIKELTSCFTTDVIGSCAFGFDCNSLKDPNNAFRRHGKRAIQFNFIESLKVFLIFGVPQSLLKKFNFRLTAQELEDFFTSIVKKTIEHRETNNVFRKDFMHLLLQLKNQGVITEDETVTKGNKSGTHLSLNEIAAECFLFFVAGFETSSTSITISLFELSKNQDIQDKLREEITTVLQKHDDEITYEGIMEMTYMDKVIHETLRKYPSVPVLVRVCNKDYLIPGTTQTIEKGTRIFIPVLGIQHDPEYFPNPEKYDPDRFSDDAKQQRHPFTWLPFGEGPRICIGMRFGMLVVKIGIVKLLRDYKFTLNEKTPDPLIMDKNIPIHTPVGGVFLNVKKV